MTLTPSSALANLKKIGELDDVPASAEQGQRKLEYAAAQLADANRDSNNNETRFECAYNAIRSVAELGLLRFGYRPSNKQGHHRTAIQSLCHTLQADGRTVQLIETLRKQRNAASYDADPVTDAALRACIDTAEQLLNAAKAIVAADGWVAQAGPGG